jgi:hypothetical protein
MSYSSPQFTVPTGSSEFLNKYVVMPISWWSDVRLLSNMMAFNKYTCADHACSSPCSERTNLYIRSYSLQDFKGDLQP